MRELSLFTGAGGGVLGSKLLEWETIGYVEYEEYCQKVLKQRIADGILDAAPIFGDIRKFIGEGYAASYRGMVDVVTAGFPCQPFSSNGKQRGKDDSRNMWPQTLEVIKQVQPRYALLENVTGLLGNTNDDIEEWSMEYPPSDNIQYFGTILNDLAKAGYNARWIVLGANDCGASHQRKRIWVLAYTSSNGWIQNDNKNGITFKNKGFSGKHCHTSNKEAWRLPTTHICRSYDGVANGVDRLKAIGNGQVPQVVRTAWELLT